MTEEDPKADEHVEDLEVPESESEDVQGGSLNFTQIKDVKASVPDAPEVTPRYHLENAWPSK